MAKVAQSIVLSRPDRIGDVVVTSSCLAAVRRAYPEAQIYFLLQPLMADLFYEHPELSGLILMPQGEGSAVKAKLAAEFRKLQVDVIIHLNGHECVEYAAYDAEVETRVGCKTSPAQWLTHAVLDRRKSGEKHEADYAFDVLKAWDARIAVPETKMPQLQLNPHSRESVLIRLEVFPHSKEFALFHLTAHGHKPRIPSKLMAALARWLVEEKGLHIVLVGAASGKEEAEFNEELKMHASCIADWAGTLSLVETGWLYSKAALAVSRDSGPAHLSAALGCPTVTLMAEPNRAKCARRWKPLGRHSYVIENAIKQRWWESDQRFAARNAALFEVDEIIAQMERALNRE